MSRANNKLEDAAYSAEYYEKHKETCRLKMRAWYKRNAPKKRARERSRNATKRQDLLASFGGVCARCGFSDWRALQLDHVNGGGHTERQAVGYNPSPEMRLAHFREHPEARKKFQVLCANCNWIKRYENQENGGPKLVEVA